MEYDPEKITNVHYYLDMVSAFIEKVPVEELKDEDWVKIKKQAIEAKDILNSILKPRPNGTDPCRGGPILQVVQDYLRELKELKKS